MKLIDYSLRNSTAVIVGILLVGLFGYLALANIPIQLNPTIEKPYITVETIYPGASATEVEQEITQPMEEKLAAVENLREMRSTSEEGASQIVLEFDWGINKDLAAIDVLQKINLVEDLPDDAEEPQIQTVNRRDEETIIYANIDSDLPIIQMRQLIDDQVLPQLERVQDVAAARLYGGAEREIHVLLDPQAVAARDLTLDEIAMALRLENRNVRGGSLDQDNSRLIVRTIGQFQNLDQIAQTIVKDGPAGAIRIRDIGTVVDASKDIDVNVRINGKPTLVLPIVKKSGANTLETADRVKQEIERLNVQLAPRNVAIRLAYDSSEYIWGSIFQVRNSLMLGALLATLILWLFLRSVASTLILGLTIPISMIGTFVLLMAFGRSVNVISLAGMGFASGMILDSGIVVIENVFRHRVELGKPILRAARDAAVEVWAPIVASSLTTLAVFIPILFIKQEAGQIFRDIAYAISFSIALSMITAITVVPMLCSRLMGGLRVKRGVVDQGDDPGLESIGEHSHVVADHDRELDEEDARGHRGFHPAYLIHRIIDPVFGQLGRIVGRFFIGFVIFCNRRRWAGLAFIALVVAGFIGSLKLVPPAEYLPTGNENLVLGIFKFPAGLSLEGSERIMMDMEEQVLALPELARTFFVIRRNSPLFGMIVKKEFADKERIQQLVGQLNGFAFSHFPFPDIFGYMFQKPVFGGAQGKSISVDVRGPDLQKLAELSGQLMGQIGAIPGVARIQPSLDLDNPELRVYPDRGRLSDMGMTASTVADAVETYVEGRIVSIYRIGGKEYDLKMKGMDSAVSTPADLEAITLSTPAGAKIKLADVARVERSLGPVKIERLEQERSTSLQVQIEETTPLESVIDAINAQVIEPMLKILPFEYTIEQSGAADDLAKTIAAMAGSFALALIIIYLLMSALFRSFLYPLIIMFSVPLSMTGAFLGIWSFHMEFNVITMLGFILLAGVVVNNAILLVELTLRCVREGMSHAEAVETAIGQRIRPIFMTSITSVLGMMPLALGKGEGTELYNSLGIAIIGGLSLSTIFTLMLIPILMKQTLDVRDGLARMLGKPEWTEAASARKLAELDEQV